MASSSTPLADRPPVPARGRPSNLLQTGLAAVAGTVLILAAWQAVATSGEFGTALPSVGPVLGRLGTLLLSPAMWSALVQTVLVAVAGLAGSAALGIVLGVLIGRIPVIRAATAVVIEFLKPIPPIVLLPLTVLIFGPTAEMALVLVLFGCTLAIAVQTIAGVTDTDPVAIDTARSFGLGRAEILWRIVLPSALPFVGTAMRIAAPAALVITVVAGLLGGSPGLGSSLYQAQAAGDYVSLYALVAILGILGVLTQLASAGLERRVLAWHPSQRVART